jgi:excisionase family DNA binding protein
MGAPKGERVAKITRKEVAKALGVDRNTITNWLKTGRLKGLTLGEIVEFDRERRKQQ